MTYLVLYDIVFLTSLLSILVAFIFTFKARKTKYLKLIQLVLFFSLAADLTYATADYIFHSYIAHVGAVYRILELIIILEFYSRIFPVKTNRIVIRSLQVILPLIFSLILSLKVTPIRITNSILFCIYSIAYFRKMIIEMSIPNPMSSPMFWINSAILLYFSGVLFLFLLFEPLAKLHEASAAISYIFHNIFLILKNILFAIGFWKATSKNKVTYQYEH